MKKHRWQRRLILLLTALMMLGTLFPPISHHAKAEVASHVVISEIYGGGGNSGATYTHDFIELYNPTDSPVTLDGWSVQYASKTGSIWNNKTDLTGTIQPHGYYLIREAQGSGGTTPLPTPDATGTIAMSASDGKVALVRNGDAITGKSDPDIVDFVGFGDANEYEGTGPTPKASNTTSVERKANNGSVGGEGNGWDTNDNKNDFSTADPDPQNSASPQEPPVGGGGEEDTRPPAVTEKSPAENEEGVAIDAPITVTFDEAIALEDEPGITIQDANHQTVSGVTYAAEGNTLTLTHPAFAYNQTYAISVPAGAVKDAAGNEAPEITWQFTTEAEEAPGQMGQVLQNPSFEERGSDKVPTGWAPVNFDAETNPHKLNIFAIALGEQYAPPAPIPDGSRAVEVFYNVGSSMGVIGAGAEQRKEAFGTVNETTQNTLSYYVVETFNPSTQSAAWGGAVAEVEFTSGGQTYKLRYYHQFSPAYSGAPADSATVKYVNGTKLTKGSWLSATQNLSADIQAKFGVTSYTVEAVRFANMVNKTAASPYPNSTTYWDNIRLEKGTLAEDTRPPAVVSFSPADRSSYAAVNAELSLLFDEPIQKGSGIITIENVTDSLSRAVDMNDAGVVVDYHKLIIPHDPFTKEKTYRVTVPAGAVKDLKGNPTSSDITWSFTVNSLAEGTIAYTRQADERGLPVHMGKTVTVEGIVTFEKNILQQSYNNYYIQDETGGINIFDPGRKTPVDVKRGDKVRITGEIDAYNGLTEIIPSKVEIIDSNASEPQPRGVTLSEISAFATAEPIEGSLVKVTAKVSGIPAKVAGGGYNVTITDGFNTITLRIMQATGIDVGDQLEVGKYYELVGVLGQYDKGENTDPEKKFVTGYQILPREAGDISAPVDPVDSLPPRLLAARAISANQVDLTFNEPLDNGATDPAYYQIDNLTVTGAMLQSGDRVVRLTTSEQTPEREYTVTVTGSVYDKSSLPLDPAYKTASFTGYVPPYQGEVQIYFGDLHDHNGVSQDGAMDARDLVAAAVASGLNFIAFTDHSYAITDEEWDYELQVANEATFSGGSDKMPQWIKDRIAQNRLSLPAQLPDSFAVIRGAEYSHGTAGHLNVFNTDIHPVRQAVNGSGNKAYIATSLDAFYQWLATQPQAIVQFNHPGWMNFEDFRYNASVEEQIQLLEVGNGYGGSYVYTEDQYQRALDYGWKVSATNNSDYHGTQGPKWGFITDHRTGILAKELSQEGLLEALRSMRTYGSEDKNFEVKYNMDGYWMGSTINLGEEGMTGTVEYNDPDGEKVNKMEVISNGGRVVRSISPASDGDPNNDVSGTWRFTLERPTGNHYYYIRITQADGDRIITSPIWTEGEHGVAVSDFTIQPAKPTTHVQTNMTARITNRTSIGLSNLTATFKVNEVTIGTKMVDMILPNEDAYVTVPWKPAETGPVTLSVQITHALAGDNPEDDRKELTLDVSDQDVPLIVIDGGNSNVDATPAALKSLIGDMVAHNYNVVLNTDELTDADLQGAKLLLLTAPVHIKSQYSDAEVNVVKEFVNGGGSLWIAGVSDFDDPDANDELNKILAAIESKIRLNDDEVLDGNHNQATKFPWGVSWHVFPAADQTGIGQNVGKVGTWSTASLVDKNKEALTNEDGVTITVSGDLDLGTSGANYNGRQLPNRTISIDADEAGDWFNYENDAPETPMPLAAAEEIGNSRVYVQGETNDVFDNWGYSSEDGRGTELYNLETVKWLMGEPLRKMSVAEARVDDDNNNSPDLAKQLVWVEGSVTSQWGEFMDVLYVQDETGGVTVFAPNGSARSEGFGLEGLKLGDKVRIVGTVDTYFGDTEIQFFEPNQIQRIEAGTPVTPRQLSTKDAASQINEGLYVKTEGVVKEIQNTQNFVIDDGSGPARVFLDYTTDFLSTIKVGDKVKVKGFAAEDMNGQRLRVPNRTDSLVITEVGEGDQVSPKLVSSTPADGATDVAPDTELSVTFDEPVVKGTGLVTIRNVTDNSNFASIDMTDVDVSERKITIPHNPFANGKRYEVRIPAGAVKDAAGNGAEEVQFTFTTRTAQGGGDDGGNGGGSGGGNGGGSGGGNGGGTTPPTTPPTPPADENRVLVEIKPEMIQEQIADQAKQEILVQVTEPAIAEGKTAEIQMTEEILTQIADSGKPVVIETPKGSVTIPSELLKEGVQNKGLKIYLTFKPGKAGSVEIAAVRTSILRSEIVSLQIDGWNGTAPVTLSVPVDMNGVDDRLKLALYKQVDGNWRYQGGVVNETKEEMSMQITGNGDYGVIYYDVTYPDIAGHWAQGSVERMASRHVIKGMNEQSFAPEGTLTRAQFAGLLVRLLQLKGNGMSTLPFADVKRSDWFYKEVGAAYENGIVQGTSAALFKPNDSVTRQDMVVMLVRALNKSGLSLTDQGGTAPSFTDRNRIASYAEEAIQLAAKAGLVTGFPEGTFRPFGVSTRAQAATLLDHVLKLITQSK